MGIWNLEAVAAALGIKQRTVVDLTRKAGRAKLPMLIVVSSRTSVGISKLFDPDEVQIWAEMTKREFNRKAGESAMRKSRDYLLTLYSNSNQQWMRKSKDEPS